MESVMIKRRGWRDIFDIILREKQRFWTANKQMLLKLVQITIVCPRNVTNTALICQEKKNEKREIVIERQPEWQTGHNISYIYSEYIFPEGWVTQQTPIRGWCAGPSGAGITSVPSGCCSSSNRLLDGRMWLLHYHVGI